AAIAVAVRGSAIRSSDGSIAEKKIDAVGSTNTIRTKATAGATVSDVTHARRRCEHRSPDTSVPPALPVANAAVVSTPRAGCASIAVRRATTSAVNAVRSASAMPASLLAQPVVPTRIQLVTMVGPEAICLVARRDERVRD